MPEVRAHRSGTFCWADLPTTDLDHTIAFYSELFNWRAIETGSEEQRYVLFQREGKTVAGAYPITAEQIENGAGPRWSSYLATKAIDELCAQAQELGATLVMPPCDVPGVARMAVLRDPEGAAFTLYQAQGSIGAEVLNEPGALCWFELYARDLEQSTRFYADLFGYELRTMAGLGGVPYVQLGIGKGAAAGALQIRPEWAEMPPMWAVYFQTDDLDAAILRAERHGGNLLMAATEIPGVGRFAMLSDPQGASFMVMQLGAAAPSSTPPTSENESDLEASDLENDLEDDLEDDLEEDLEDIASEVEAGLMGGNDEPKS